MKFDCSTQTKLQGEGSLYVYIYVHGAFMEQGYIYLCGGICMHVGAHVCANTSAHMQTPGVNTRYLPQLFSTLLWDTGSPAEPRVHQLVKLGGQ